MYFGNEVLQEAIYEQTVLNEMHISKKDLENPDILKKVLEKSEKECKIINKGSGVVGFLLGTSAAIITGIIAGDIILALPLFIPFLFGALLIASKFVKSDYDVKKKNLDKIISKVEELINKTEKLKTVKRKQIF